MVNSKVGFVAGDIFDFLDKEGEVSIHDLRNGLALNPTMLQMGIGWLAREDKVKISKRGTEYVIRLKEE